MSDTAGDRVRLVRKNAGLTTTEFAERIGVTNPAISILENNKSGLSNRMCRAICREFHINETWLRTGEGEMFTPQTRQDEISDFLGSLLEDQPDFRHRFVRALASMTIYEWALLERKIREITDEKPDPE